MVRIVRVHPGKAGRPRLALIEDGVPAPPRRLPADFGRNPRDVKRYRDTVTLLRRVEAFVQKHRNKRAAVIWAMVEERFGEWARERGLRVSRRTLIRYARRIDSRRLGFDGNRDGRGNPGRSKGRRCSPEAWRRFCQYAGDPSIESLVEAHRRTAEEAARHGWTWYMSPRSGQARAKRELPRKAIRVRSFQWRRGRR